MSQVCPFLTIFGVTVWERRSKVHSAPVFLPVKFFAVDPNLFFTVLHWWRLYGGRGGVLPQDVAKALKVQFADPVFHWQFPLLLGIGPVSNQAIRPEAQMLGHRDVALVEPAELLRFWPAI